MARYIKEGKKTPVTAKADVLVAGGGIAGVSAALAAARSGKKVLLCEREFTLGGLGTLGLVVIYLPLDDGNGKQVSFGIAEELCRLSMKRGQENCLCHNVPAEYPKPWLEGGTLQERIGDRFEVHYNPWTFAFDMEELLTREGVEILYGTWVADTEVKDGAITHVMLENIDGRTAVSVKSVVDATGDAVVARQAGEETALYGLGNVQACWYYYRQGEAMHLREFSDPIPTPGKTLKEGVVTFSGVDARKNSQMLLTAHRRMMAEWAGKCKDDPRTQILAVPAIPQHRMTRRIVGAGACALADTGKRLESSIGCFGNWIRPDPGHEVPFEALYGKKVKNLITAGRCISALDDVWDLTRVIPVCAVTGEAAGVAAAMSRDFAKLSVKKLQNELVRRGVKLHLDD